MGTAGKKVNEKSRTEIIRLSKEYSPAYIGRHLKLSTSTVRRALERDREEKVVASRSFHKHGDDLKHSCKYIVSNLMLNKELLNSLLAHFKQEYPEFAHLNTWQDVSQEDVNSGLFKKLELLAESRSFTFCAECPICQNIKRRLRESA